MSRDAALPAVFDCMVYLQAAISEGGRRPNCFDTRNKGILRFLSAARFCKKSAMFFQGREPWQSILF